MINIKPFLDGEGRIAAWPSRNAKKLAVLLYMSEKFELGRVYTEREVNALIEQWETIGDLFLLRRGMVDAGYMSRTTNGSAYRRVYVEPEREA